MANKIELSIIIVTWNSAQEIEKCLQSLQLTIKHYNYEIIVVDNASKDFTQKIIKEKFLNVKLIDSIYNLGFATANNIALKKAQGNYVLFLNPDTIMQPQTVDKCLNFFSSHKDYGALACCLLNFDGSIQPSIYKLPSRLGIFIETFNLQNRFPKFISQRFGYSHEYSHEIECCMGAFICMSRKDALKIGGFSEEYFMYMEDGDLCWKIKHQLHKSIYFLHDITCIHLGGCSERKDISTSKLSKMMLSIVLFWKLRHQNEWRAMITYYRLLYASKMIIAKLLSLLGKDEYKGIVKNCKEAMRILKEQLKVK